MLEFLSARSERQREAFDNIRRRVEAYDVECIDTLIGDIVPPAELMKTQTDRKIAEELQRTYDVQREAQVQRQELERETAIANMQAEVVRSEQRCASPSAGDGGGRDGQGRGGGHEARAPRPEAAALRLRAEAEAAAKRCAARPRRRRRRRSARPRPRRTDGGGGARRGGYTAMQLAASLAEHQMKLVPESGDTENGSIRRRRSVHGQAPDRRPPRSLIEAVLDPRQGELEDGAAARMGGGAERAVVGLDDGARDRQAQAGVLVARVGLVRTGAEEAVEDAAEVLGRDAGASVAHPDDRGRADAPDLHLDGHPRRREAARVVEQVVEDLAEAIGGRARRRWAARRSPRG